MRTRLAAACAILLALGTPASAHRLDEYLQATTISVEKNRIQAQMRLTPGVAVFRTVFAGMDANRDGVLSETERRTYAAQVVGALSLTLDGKRLHPRLVSWKFPKIAEMKEGRGNIDITFEAAAPRVNGSRKLVFENHHQSRIAVYLVNCLVPSDPDIQVTAQDRDYRQTRYELNYVQTDVSASGRSSIGRAGALAWAGLIALLLFAPLAWLRCRSRPANKAALQ